MGPKNTNKDIKYYPVELIPISKTSKDQNGNIVEGIDVETHCTITGFVAEELIKTFTSNSKRNLFPKYSDFIAAIHDIGKISPYFQEVIYGNIPNFNKSEHKEFSNVNEITLQNYGRKNSNFHASVTQYILEHNSLFNTKYLPKIEGKHHGFIPNTENTEFGGIEWGRQQNKVLSDLETKFNFNKSLFSDVDSDAKANILCGLVVVSDWIASGGEFAKLTLKDKKSDDELRLMAKNAVENAGFHKIQIKSLSFKKIFGFKPNDVQKKLYKNVSGPGVYILEAPMGIGKTEAALYLAYKMLLLGLADGIYFGLPTQLTSDKMYDRVKKFLDKICIDNDVSLNLLYNMSWIRNKSLGGDGDVGGSWFDSSKRGLLSPFAVGTVDQVLMSVMNIKHNMVRAFGLAGKVVILDEVHSYDSYTGTILNEAVDFLRDANCTVIILSATLTTNQKSEILKQDSSKFINKYPLISSINNSGEFKQIACRAPKNHKVDLHMVYLNTPNAMDNLINCIIDKAEKGEQILWIENTVFDCQSIYKEVLYRILNSKVPIECGIIHSRFTKSERNKNEDYWTSIYGKNAIDKRKACGRILIGTQVLEQSLDIDADCLVTRICPMDMLAQRSGRLYRHKENNKVRPKSSKCEVFVISPSFDNVLEQNNCFGKTAYVYSEYVLYRTLKVLKDIKKMIIPKDIRRLLESVYSEQIETGRIKELKDNLEEKRNNLRIAAKGTFSNLNKTQSDLKVQTRYSEENTVKVLLIKSFIDIGDSYKIELYDGTEILILKNTSKGQSNKSITCSILENCVITPEIYAPNFDDYINELFSNYLYTGYNKDIDKDETYPFRIAIVEKDDSLRDINHNPIIRNKKSMFYNKVIGYFYEKTEKD